jgi:hypothetical protein
MSGRRRRKRATAKRWHEIGGGKKGSDVSVFYIGKSGSHLPFLQAKIWMAKRCVETFRFITHQAWEQFNLNQCVEHANSNSSRPEARPIFCPAPHVTD